MSTELLPCPFCGGDDILIDENAHDTPELKYQCWCEDCGCSCDGKPTKAEAWTAWNRRFVCLDKDGEKVFAGDKVRRKISSGYYDGIVTWRVDHADWVVLTEGDSAGWGIISDQIELIKEDT